MLKHGILFSLAAITLLAAGPAPGGDGFTQPALESAYMRLAPAIGLVEYAMEVRNSRTGEPSRRSSAALALVVSPDGLVMARGHIQLANTEPINIRVKLGRGENEKSYPAELLEKPEDVNVSFLRLQSGKPLNLPYVKFAKNSGLELGTPVAAVGILGDTLDNNPALWEGRIASVLDEPRKTYCLDAGLPYTFIGGPIVNTRGEAVGVAGFDLSRNEGGDVYVHSGQPLVFYASLFQKYIDNPPSDTGMAGPDDAYLGVFTQPLTDDLAEYWNLPKRGGLVVSTVVSGSPAATAGFETGDVITKFNGRVMNAKQDRDVLAFTVAVREAGLGVDVPVEALRGGEPINLSVRLAPRPISSQDAEEFEDPVFGLTVRELTSDIRIALNLNDEVQGVIVSRVKSGSIAQLGKMFPGAIILQFGGHPVTSLETYKSASEAVVAQKPAEVPVFARAGTNTGFFRLEPRWSE